jgi:hypothetical protein
MHIITMQSGTSTPTCPANNMNSSMVTDNIGAVGIPIGSPQVDQTAAPPNAQNGTRTTVNMTLSPRNHQQPQTQTMQ